MFGRLPCRSLSLIKGHAHGCRRAKRFPNARPGGGNGDGLSRRRLHLPGRRSAALHVCRPQGSGRLSSSKDKLIETIREGKAFGMLGLVDGKPRTSTARAMEDCELALLDQKKFRFMVDETPNFVWLCHQRVCVETARDQRTAVTAADARFALFSRVEPTRSSLWSLSLLPPGLAGRRGTQAQLTVCLRSRAPSARSLRTSFPDTLADNPWRRR